MLCSSLSRPAARLLRLVALPALTMALSTGLASSAVAQEAAGLPSIAEKTRNTERMEGFFNLY